MVGFLIADILKLKVNNFDLDGSSIFQTFKKCVTPIKS